MTLFNSKKIIPFEKVDLVAKDLKAQKETIVFTNGCFDILHAGHIDYLRKARALGTCLWLGLNSDHSIKTIKGPTRPVQSESARAYVLAGLEMVDYITIFNESTPIELISTLKPAIHVKGGDYKKEDLPEYGIVTGYGGRVEIQPFVPGFSTSSIIAKLER